MSRIPITQEMVECAKKAILKNEAPDREIAAKCLGDPRRTDTVSDMRRSFGLKKNRKTGGLHPCPPRGKRTWANSSMPR
jgi:hypothetical protein